MPSASRDTAPLWVAPTAARVNATVVVPGSKSITNRALILAALTPGESRIDGALRSRDTTLMVGALRQLGVRVDDIDGVLVVHGGHFTAPDGTIDCGLAGTVMRFLPPLAALAVGSVTIDGDEQARIRPMTTILNALRDLGVAVDGDRLPFTLVGTGEVAGGVVRIDSSGSSQFVSGLLLSGPSYRDGLTVIHEGPPVPSQPHLDMTVAMLREAGATVDDSVPGRWIVAPGGLTARMWTVEPDLSNATPFLAAAAVTGGQVSIPLWPAMTTQPGDAMRSILRQMGAEVSLTDGTLTVVGPEVPLRGLDIDLRDVGELTPTVAALAALASTPSRLRGIAHLRGHETDRLAALAAEITALGGQCTETEDGLSIEPAPLHGGQWHSYADHRMATAGAILGLVVDGVLVEDIETTAKTLPDFDRMWADMIGGK